MSARSSYSHHHENQYNEESDSDSSASGAPAKRGADSGAGSRPPPKKRNRAALSCTLCRERKVKCDRVIPCQQCIKRGDRDFCHLDPNKRGPQVQSKVGAAKKPEHLYQHPPAPYVESGPTTFPDTTMSAMPSTSSAAEVDAIKARLAQLEQALAQQQNMQQGGPSPGFSSNSSSGFSPMPSSNNISSRLPWNFQTGSSGNSIPTMSANQFSPPPSHRPSTGSATSANYYAQQQRGDEGPGERLPPLVNGLSPSGGPGYGMLTTLTPQHNRLRSSTDAVSTASSPLTKNDSHSTDKPQNRGDVDSDTEDAALVLEGLAMGAGRTECGNKKSGSGQGDVIEKPAIKSIQGYVEDDKQKDIMSEDRYPEDVPMSNPEKHSSFANAKGALPTEGPSSECKKSHADCDKLAELLKRHPDAEFGPDGKRIPPAMRVCVLLSKHENSLFNLVYGPETFLGWGMGWAFAAAEAAGDMMSVSDVVGCKGALQREAVLRAIIRSLPDRKSAEHLVDIYANRIKFLTGNCVHMPTFKKELAAFYDLSTVEKRARVINFVDPAWLSLFLMMLVLALHFHPCERPESVMHFFDGRTVHLWRSAAHTCLVLARYQSSSSMAVLQAIILIDLHMMGTGKQNNSLHSIAVNNAVEMGLHRLGAKDKQPKAGESSAITIRREIAKRIWHMLVLGDWCTCNGNDGFYRIHPGQFNTPLPGNYNDADLEKSPLPAPRPMTEHTEMSFFLSELKIVTVIRENVDMQNNSPLENGRLTCSDGAYLDGRYRGLLEQAPSFYKIGSEEGYNENMEVERWLFQQFVFDKLLRLHRPQLSSKAGARTSCVLLARSILDMQRRIRSRCTVADRLYMILMQSFSAAIVLCLDLLQTPPSSSMRNIVRGEISEALKALRHVGASHHSTEHNIRVIDALLEEEEARWKQSSSRKPSNPMRKKNLLNLALRVAKAARGEEQFQPAVDTHEEMKNEESSKDEQSRQLMDQLLMGPTTFDEPSSFSRAPFQSNASGPTLFAPSGLNFADSLAPYSNDNGQQFDLAKFLADMDSPGSASSASTTQDPIASSGASDSGHSSLHGGRANSTTSSNGGRMSHSSSFSQLGNSNESRSPAIALANGELPASLPTQGLSPNAPEQSTNLDSFWMWILNQGNSAATPGVGADVRMPPLGAVSGNLAPTSAPSTQQMPPSSKVAPTDADFQDLFSRTLGSDKRGSASLPNENSTSQSGRQSSSQAFNTSSKSGVTPAIPGSINEPVLSVGTPSAGIDSSWMSMPGLFELAHEFDTASYPGGYPPWQPQQQQATVGPQ